MFILSILGKPQTKQRARSGMGKTKTGKSYHWAYTESSWAEDMIRRAFLDKYPDSKPYGHECAYFDDTKQKWKFDSKNYSVMSLTKVEIDVIFYCLGGQVGDEDNYLKLVKDALNGLAYIDDKQVKHTMPFVVSLDDPDYNGWLEHDEKVFNNCSTQERTDILIRKMEPQPRRLLALRNWFEKNVQHSYDYLKRYYSGIQDYKKAELVSLALDCKIDVEKKTKDQLIEELIQYDLKHDNKINDGVIKRRK